MRTQKSYNKQMEALNAKFTKKEARKKYSEIVKELGERHITLSDIDNNFSGKERGFIDMLNNTSMTMDDVLVLQQYAKAILHQDTRAAEFLRDTAGEKPSTQVDLSATTEGGLSKMSLEELKELRDLLKGEE